MNVGECMEYAQKLCDATTAAERNQARAELRAVIEATIAAERERCIAAVVSLHMTQATNNQNHPAAWHDGVDAAIEAMREAERSS